MDGTPRELLALIDLVKGESAAAVGKRLGIQPQRVIEMAESKFCSMTSVHLEPGAVLPWLQSMKDGVAFIEEVYIDYSEANFTGGGLMAA